MFSHRLYSSSLAHCCPPLRPCLHPSFPLPLWPEAYTFWMSLLQLGFSRAEHQAGGHITGRQCCFGRQWPTTASCWPDPCGDILPLNPVASLLTHPSPPRLCLMTKSLPIPHAGQPLGHVKGLFGIHSCPFTSSRATQFWWSQHFLDNLFHRNKRCA